MEKTKTGLQFPRTPNKQNNLEKEQLGGLILIDFGRYCKATVLKTIGS